MISFRYHIVSLTAVFLAIGLGFVLGSAIQPTNRTTRNSISRLTRELSGTRAQIADLRNQMQASSSVVKNLSTRVIRGAFAGRQVLYADDGSSGSWDGGVRKAMADATATDVGGITLTGKWTDPGAAADLVTLAASAGVKVGSQGAGPALMTAVGAQLGQPQAASLVTSLAQAGYVHTGPKTTGTWPPAGVVVVVFTSGHDTPQDAALAAFARGAANSTPAAVIAAAPDDLGAVGVLRRDGAGNAKLATFDSGSVDATGIGAVLALGAAIDGNGGDFGAAPGLSYLPPA